MFNIWGFFSVCSPLMLSWNEIVLRRTSQVSWEICLQISQVSAFFQGIFNPCALKSKPNWINRENFELNFPCLNLLVVLGSLRTVCMSHLFFWSLHMCCSVTGTFYPVLQYLSSAVPVLYVWWSWNSQYKNQLGEINWNTFPFPSIWFTQF